MLNFTGYHTNTLCKPGFIPLGPRFGMTDEDIIKTAKGIAGNNRDAFMLVLDQSVIQDMAQQPRSESWAKWAMGVIEAKKAAFAEAIKAPRPKSPWGKGEPSRLNMEG
ncbi:MAG: hypothetical protein ACPG5T_10830 [Endozoicomonas sp.]